MDGGRKLALSKASEIRSHIHGIEQGLRLTRENAYRAGELLAEVKEALKGEKGGFVEYAEKTIGISKSKAYYLIGLVEDFPTVGKMPNEPIRKLIGYDKPKPPAPETSQPPQSLPAAGGEAAIETSDSVVGADLDDPTPAQADRGGVDGDTRERQANTFAEELVCDAGLADGRSVASVNDSGRENLAGSTPARDPLQTIKSLLADLQPHELHVVRDMIDDLLAGQTAPLPQSGGGGKKKTAKKKDDFDPLNVDFPTELCGSAEFDDAWHDWVQHRNERKPKLTPLAVTKSMNAMAEWGVKRAVAAINHSIANSYQGIFEPTSNGKPAKQRRALL